MPATLGCHLHKHTTHSTHATHASPPLTLDASTSPMSTILARFPRKHATHAIHATTGSAPFLRMV